MTAWLFGKLPAHGDFVARGIDGQAREELDGYLTESLADARVHAAADSEDAYEEAPPWRFAWRAGGGWTAGALALSVDAVGRRYPLLVGRTDLMPAAVEDAADQLEGLLYDALAEGWTVDRLHDAIAAVAPRYGEPWTGGEAWWTLGGERFNEASLAGARPGRLVTAMVTTAGDRDGA